MEDAASTRFYFIRHGETDYNRNRIIQGRKINSTLNETGESQAEAVGRRLSSVPVDVIYASPMRRTRETAAAIAAHHPSARVRYLEDLEEMSWGVFEGEPLSSDVSVAFEKMNDLWNQGDYETPIEGGESISQVQRRSLRALDTMLAESKGKDIVVVTHGRLLRVLLASALDGYGLERMGEIQHANTSVNEVLFDGDRFEPILLNCTAHLERSETIMVE